ncbi:hypothetical protein ACSQ67_001523 [Phaseolus vulgaris]
MGLRCWAGPSLFWVCLVDRRLARLGKMVGRIPSCDPDAKRIKRENPSFKGTRTSFPNRDLDGSILHTGLLDSENRFPLKGFHFSVDMEEEEDYPYPKSLEKPNTSKTKRRRMDDGISGDTLGSMSSGDGRAIVELGMDFVGEEVEYKLRARSYVSRSAIALRCGVMPPACTKNNFMTSLSEEELVPFRLQNSKCADLFPSLTRGNGQSRYHNDFYQYEQIGRGNFSNVYKVLKQLDGCLYVVKCTTKKLGNGRERIKAYTKFNLWLP